MTPEIIVDAAFAASFQSRSLLPLQDTLVVNLAMMGYWYK